MFAIALLVTGACTAAGSGGAAVAPSLASSSPPEPAPAASPEGLSEPEAVAAARQHVSDDAAEVWATESGPFEDVFGSLAHQPAYLEEPATDAAAPDLMTWAVEFKESIEICGPSGGKCETRDALTTVFIDYKTGEFLTSSTFAPSPGDALPRS